MRIKKIDTNYRIAFYIICFSNSIIYFLKSNGIFGKIGAFCFLLAGIYAILKK